MATLSLLRSIKYLPRKTLLTNAHRGSTNIQGRYIYAWVKAKNRETDPEKLKEATDPGMRLGDYPIYPWISAQELPPTGWWDNQDRRNKDTPLHEEDDVLSMWMYDAVDYNGRYTDNEILLHFLIGLGVMLGVVFLGIRYAPEPIAAPKQYPYNDLYLERGGDPSTMPT